MSILAIDFGGTRIRAGWFNESLELLQRSETYSRVEESQDAVIARILDTAREVIPAWARPVAVGIAAPGPLDAERGVIRHALTLSGWREVPLSQIVTEAFGAPVAMHNDANLAALAEYHRGAGRGADPMLYLTLSTGIGGGAVIGGRLFTGWRGLAIEPGHQRFVHPQDGRVYRLEALSSGTALGQWARRALETGETPSLLREREKVDGQAVGEAALAGDALALQVVDAAARWLGLGLANLIHLFNPQAIVLGGSVTRLGDLLLNPVREVVAAELLDPAFNAPHLIRLAGLGDDVCLIGAASYALSQG